MTVCGGIVLACRSFIPDENLVFCQDFLMRQIISNIHYAPETWLREAHSTEVCKEFGQLFQLRAQYFLEELFSPVLTPFVLLFRYFCLFFSKNFLVFDLKPRTSYFSSISIQSTSMGWAMFVRMP